MSKQNIENITNSDSNFAPIFIDHHVLLDITFNGHCSANYNTSLPKKIVNIYVFLTY